NIWTEHIRTEERVQYMAFHRAADLSELGWSRPQDLSWEGFAARLPDELGRYRALGIHASEDAFTVSIEARMAPGGRGVQVQLAKQAAPGEIRYTRDQSNPTQTATLYTGPLTLPVGGELRAAAFDAGGALTAVTARSLDAGSIARRSSQELKTCTSRLVLNLEDDAPVEGPRAIFLVDILNPCWIYEAVDLSHVTAVKAAVGQVPF